MTERDQLEDEEIQGGCGGYSPDTWCGECADCLEGLDEWRELNGIEEAR
jgi:hypothetical protein